MKRGCTIKKLPLFIAMLVVSTFVFAQSGVKVGFHDFPWGTSIEAFKAKIGNPVHVDEFNGLQSLIYEDIQVSGYPVFMLVYFSQNGLEGGTYYFHTFSLEELRNCYISVQAELVEQYGSTYLFDEMQGPRGQREMRTYETSWNLPDGYIYLKVNTRNNEPVTLWYSSPALTRRLRGS